jgi:hypothetical protein
MSNNVSAPRRRSRQGPNVGRMEINPAERIPSGMKCFRTDGHLSFLTGLGETLSDISTNIMSLRDLVIQADREEIRIS